MFFDVTCNLVKPNLFFTSANVMFTSSTFPSLGIKFPKFCSKPERDMMQLNKKVCLCQIKFKPRIQFLVTKTGRKIENRKLLLLHWLAAQILNTKQNCVGRTLNDYLDFFVEFRLQILNFPAFAKAFAKNCEAIIKIWSRTH